MAVVVNTLDVKTGKRVARSLRELKEEPAEGTVPVDEITGWEEGLVPACRFLIL